MQSVPDRQMADPREAAESLGVSPGTVRRLCAQGRIRGAVKVGNAVWRIPFPIERLPPAGKPRITLRAGTANKLDRPDVQFGKYSEVAVDVAMGMTLAAAAAKYDKSVESVEQIIERASAIRARNLEVIEAAERGMQRSKIADLHGITPPRVTQLVIEASRLLSLIE